MKRGIDSAVDAAGLGAYIQVQGKPCCLSFTARDRDEQRSQAFRSLLLQETIKRGVLMPSLVVSFSHTDQDIDQTVEAISRSLDVYQRALTDGVDRYLVGRPSKVVQRRFN